MTTAVPSHLPWHLPGFLSFIQDFCTLGGLTVWLNNKIIQRERVSHKNIILRRSIRDTDRSQETLTNRFDAVGRGPAQEIDPKEIMRRSVT